MRAAPPAAPGRPSVVRIPDPPDAETFAQAIRLGLAARPRTLPCRYFYDEEGSRLFERICELSEYYLTRTEDAILRDHGAAMVSGWSRAPTLIELGSGSSSKTRRLIAAALAEYGGLHYVPIDVSSAILDESAAALAREFPGLRVDGYAADYRSALSVLSGRGRRPKLLVFLGSSLGNYGTEAAVDLLSAIADGMGPADRLLLGTDLIKDRATLEAAYNDAEGVTAKFNRNLLVRINRELGADFDPESFAHEARYRDERRCVEMHLVSRRSQVVTIPGAALEVPFEPGESIHTEDSHKYDLDGLRALARAAGLVEEAAWTDADGAFRVQRWRQRSNRGG